MPDTVHDTGSDPRAAYLTWLRGEVRTWCNDDGYFEVEWGPEDSITPDQLLEAYRNYERDGFDSPRAYLEHEFSADSHGDADVVFYDDYLLPDLMSASQASPEIKLGFFDSKNIWDDLESVGFRGIDRNLDDLLDQSELHFNVHFATEEELDHDMGSIVDSFGSSSRGLDPDPVVGLDLDNALSYLVNQQGHSVTEVYGALGTYDGYSVQSESVFIASVCDEIVENPSEYMSELTALVRMDGRQALDFMSAVEKGADSIVLPKDDATIGIFNQWVGTGSLLGISLEKDAVLPLSMVREFSIENQTEPFDGYTVGSVYCTNDPNLWGEFSYQSGVEPDVREDYEAALATAERERQMRASLDPRSIRDQLERAVDDRLQDASAFVADPSDSSSMSILYEATEDDDRLDSLSTCGNALFSVRYGLYDDNVARDELLSSATEEILRSDHPLGTLHDELDSFSELCAAVDSRIADIRSVTAAPQESLECDIASLGASPVCETDAATYSIDQER